MLQEMLPRSTCSQVEEFHALIFSIHISRTPQTMRQATDLRRAPSRLCPSTKLIVHLFRSTRRVLVMLRYSMREGKYHGLLLSKHDIQARFLSDNKDRLNNPLHEPFNWDNQARLSSNNNDRLNVPFQDPISWNIQARFFSDNKNGLNIPFQDPISWDIQALDEIVIGDRLLKHLIFCPCRSTTRRPLRLRYPVS